MRAARAGLTVALLAALALPAGGVIPSLEKLADAVADTNRVSGRAEPLWVDVSLRIGDGEPMATGVLASHPTGLARLELRSRRGFVERHLLQGDAYTASRDGEIVEQPRPFLPPLFLLQTPSGATLRAAMASFGVAGGDAVLGRLEDHDCYVFGGRLPRAAERAGRTLPSVWVDAESYAVVRVDRRDGVSFHFGPPETFEGIRAPRWIRIESPDHPTVRLDVHRVAPASAPAAAFGTDWLRAPTIP